MLRTMRLVAGKDLRIEARSRVATNQVLPFAVVVLVLFAFALDPGQRRAAPGHARVCSGWPSSSACCSPSSARSGWRPPTARGTGCG